MLFKVGQGYILRAAFPGKLIHSFTLLYLPRVRCNFLSLSLSIDLVLAFGSGAHLQAESMRNSTPHDSRRRAGAFGTCYFAGGTSMPVRCCVNFSAINYAPELCDKHQH
jgi:hypothetical protein